MLLAEQLRKLSSDYSEAIKTIAVRCKEEAVAGNNICEVEIKYAAPEDIKMLAAWAKREGFKRCCYNVVNKRLVLEW